MGRTSGSLKAMNVDSLCCHHSSPRSLNLATMPSGYHSVHPIAHHASPWTNGPCVAARLWYFQRLLGRITRLVMRRTRLDHHSNSPLLIWASCPARKYCTDDRALGKGQTESGTVCNCRLHWTGNSSEHAWISRASAKRRVA